MAAGAYIAWFDEIGLGDREQVGGKGGSLGELRRAGIDVPAGYIVRTPAFERFLESLEREAPVRAAVAALGSDDLEAITACSRALRRRMEEAELPAEVLAELSAAHERLVRADTEQPVAVRSSATCEDALEASFAGLQDTYLWVKGAAQMISRVRSCWASLYSVESISYRRKHGFAEERVAMAVVVQHMVDARTAGVMFTRSPTTGDRSVVTIEGAWGLGSAVVGGEVTPDHWVLGKITGEISVREISDKSIRHAPSVSGGVESVAVEGDRRCAPCLSDEELQELRTLARRIERHYGCAQDIEWAIDRRSGAILLLQSRPETVWSARDAAPIAKREENPLLHLMSIFGTRRCP
ncbi:MAG TPA: PEP/pyruvate-binding domain-containing protein [Steroidobacteraceae bacterium]|jgi:pyruvate,water dikinase|nr:PEP/pyruvate-binding domain-containing protein [Steroidobacteraceae bacterium]